jgi:hypothetical protein
MKIFYKKSYQLIAGMTACVTCPFNHSPMCVKSDSWFHCRKHKLVLKNAKIFNL